MSCVSCVRRRGVGLSAAVLVLWCLLVPLGASAEQFTGKVVGIADGDTISVLREGKAVKVRVSRLCQGIGTEPRNVPQPRGCGAGRVQTGGGIVGEQIRTP